MGGWVCVSVCVSVFPSFFYFNIATSITITGHSQVTGHSHIMFYLARSYSIKCTLNKITITKCITLQAFALIITTSFSLLLFLLLYSPPASTPPPPLDFFNFFLRGHFQCLCHQLQGQTVSQLTLNSGKYSFHHPFKLS